MAKETLLGFILVGGQNRFSFKTTFYSSSNSWTNSRPRTNQDETQK
jgi:hypothetical protein